jgi:hypothetical protein
VFQTYKKFAKKNPANAGLARRFGSKNSSVIFDNTLGLG